MMGGWMLQHFKNARSIMEVFAEDTDCDDDNYDDMHDDYDDDADSKNMEGEPEKDKYKMWVNLFHGSNGELDTGAQEALLQWFGGNDEVVTWDAQTAQNPEMSESYVNAHSEIESQIAVTDTSEEQDSNKLIKEDIVPTLEKLSPEAHHELAQASKMVWQSSPCRSRLLWWKMS
ncbi:large ribosomal subunit protein mL48 isoform X3 [Scyliorhinus torazame]|uniref:large ribosomal subunit protein mL48 isoform X3 n=1 Tax=Scyliorhinus torazame TaxID=75743 RepID=UPI003B5C00CF